MRLTGGAFTAVAALAAGAASVTQAARIFYPDDSIDSKASSFSKPSFSFQVAARQPQRQPNRDAEGTASLELSPRGVDEALRAAGSVAEEASSAVQRELTSSSTSSLSTGKARFSPASTANALNFLPTPRHEHVKSNIGTTAAVTDKTARGGTEEIQWLSLSGNQQTVPRRAERLLLKKVKQVAQQDAQRLVHQPIVLGPEKQAAYAEYVKQIQRIQDQPVLARKSRKTKNNEYLRQLLAGQGAQRLASQKTQLLSQPKARPLELQQATKQGSARVSQQPSNLSPEKQEAYTEYLQWLDHLRVQPALAAGSSSSAVLKSRARPTIPAEKLRVSKSKIVKPKRGSAPKDGQTSIHEAARINQDAVGPTIPASDHHGKQPLVPSTTPAPASWSEALANMWQNFDAHLRTVHEPFSPYQPPPDSPQLPF